MQLGISKGCVFICVNQKRTAFIHNMHTNPTMLEVNNLINVNLFNFEGTSLIY